jgi:hypothetical protein
MFRFPRIASREEARAEEEFSWQFEDEARAEEDYSWRYEENT